MNVLLVEDGRGDAALFCFYLRKHIPGASVQHVKTVNEAIESLQEGCQSDVIVLDLGLADSVRAEAVFKLASIAPDIPLVVWTGADHYESECLQTGAKAYFVKSRIDDDRLINYLQDICAKGPSG